MLVTPLRYNLGDKLHFTGIETWDMRERHSFLRWKCAGANRQTAHKIKLEALMIPNVQFSAGAYLNIACRARHFPC